MSWGRYVGKNVRIEWKDRGEQVTDFRVLRVIDTRYEIAELRDPTGKVIRASLQDIRKLSVMERAA